MLRNVHCLGIAILTAFFLPFSSAGQSCSNALVNDTYSMSSKKHELFSLAQSIDEGTYEQIKRKAGGNAVIYGIPMGGNLSEFKENIHTLSSRFEEHLDLEESTNVAWSGLSEVSERAYRDCLMASQHGLSLELTAATETEVSFIIHWSPVGQEAASPRVPISWQWSGAGSLPPTIIAGDTPIVIPRPSRNLVLAASTNGHTTVPYKITAWPKPPSDCDVFASHPQIDACFSVAIKRPLENSRVELTNSCNEAWDWSIWFGTGSAYGNWAFHDQQRALPGWSGVYDRSPTNGEQRVFAKPAACQRVPFPQPGQIEWNQAW